MHGGTINDYIWEESKINCKIDSLGNIYTTRLIKRGEELFMSYGMEYDWDRVKINYHSSLLQEILAMTMLLPEQIATPHPDTICDVYNEALQDTSQIEFHKMLTAFFAHDKGPKHVKSKRITNTCDQVLFPLHSNAPTLTEGMSTLQWIEKLITTEWFYRQQCFREHRNPIKLIIRPTIKVAIIGERTSERIASKVKMTYSLMCDDPNVG